MKMNKKGMDVLTEHVIFIILVIIFFTSMFVFVFRTGTRASLLEESYANQIALIIDKAKIGTSVDLDVSNLYSTADKNKFNLILNINNDEKYVEVKLAPGKGTKHIFFSGNNVVWNLDKSKQSLHIEVR